MEVTVPEVSHNCILEYTVANVRSTSSRQQWVQEILPQHLIITQSIRPMAIQDSLRLRFSEVIDYQVALRAKQALLSEGLRLQAHRPSFSKWSAYLEVLKQQNPEVRTHLFINLTNLQFQHIFICPEKSAKPFEYCRHFIAIDGTHLTGKFCMTLLLAVTIDLQGQNLLLAWSVVKSKNESSWDYIFPQLQPAIPAIQTEPLTLISDHDKGLIKASEILSPLVLCATVVNIWRKVSLGIMGKKWQVYFEQLYGQDYLQTLKDKWKNYEPKSLLLRITFRKWIDYFGLLYSFLKIHDDLGMIPQKSLNQ